MNIAHQTCTQKSRMQVGGTLKREGNSRLLPFIDIRLKDSFAVQQAEIPRSDNHFLFMSLLPLHSAPSNHLGGFAYAKNNKSCKRAALYI